MSERRILVIASQCNALGELNFLPRVAEELYSVMIDPERGACGPALRQGGLLIDPTVEETKDAIREAYRRAAKDEATLFIAYIGHGEKADDDFYLLPLDAESPPDSDTAVHLTNLIKEVHKKAPGLVDGLAVLVDACYSGQAGYGAAQSWVRGLSGMLRFEVLTASADRPAADGCFSRSIAELLRNGVSAVPSEHLHCVNLRPLIKKKCPHQEPQNPAYNPDETLWLAKNAGAIREPWAQTPLADEIQRLTLAYQPTPALADVLTLWNEHPSVALIGDAGAGKSAMAAALAWPKAAKGLIAAGFINAIAFLTEATTPLELARVLTAQLARSVKGFREAQQSFARDTPYEEQQKLDTLERQLLGPLVWLGRQPSPGTIGEVRIVVDALDRLAVGARGSVMNALNHLEKVDFVRLLVTARPDTRIPEGAAPFVLGPAPAEGICRYLDDRHVPASRHAEIVQAAAGSWLVIRMLADLIWQQSDAPIVEGQLALSDIYEEMLGRCGAIEDENLGRVLTILAAAGAGPLLPFPLLCKANELLGGSASAALVRNQLVHLRGLAVRAAAGTDKEHCGLFHQTLADYVAARSPGENARASQALVDGIQALAPIASPGLSPIDLADPIQRYAFEREAEHLWKLGAIEEALLSLSVRISPVPRDNLRRWELWLSRTEARFGTDHPITFTVRSNVAHSVAECGEVRKGLRLLQALLPDEIRVLGNDHPEVLRTRNGIALVTGQCGHTREALQLFQALLPDAERILGPDHMLTLAARNNAAYFMGECGSSGDALRLLQALLPDQERVLGRDHRDVLMTRNNIALAIRNSGNLHEALRLFQALLPDQERVLGLDHPQTLTIRNNIAYLTGECGDTLKAHELFEALLSDQERILGSDHPDVLRSRNNSALWLRNSGNLHEALRLFQALLPDQERVLGLDHPQTLTIRNNIAYLTGECGDPHKSIELFETLLSDQERILGPDHPDVLRSRNNLALSILNSGDLHEALSLFQALLPDQERVLGHDHPQTLTVRSNIAYLMSECGDTQRALEMFEALLRDQERVLGLDHPDTRVIRQLIAKLQSR